MRSRVRGPDEPDCGTTRVADLRSIRAVAFDLDGTLIDSAPDILAAWAANAGHGS